MKKATGFTDLYRSEKTITDYIDSQADEHVRKKSEKHEKLIAKKIGGRKIRGSGSGRHKGDIAASFKTGNNERAEFLFEMKETEKDSITIKKDWLKKINMEAAELGKLPGLITCISDEVWVSIPLHVFKSNFVR